MEASFLLFDGAPSPISAPAGTPSVTSALTGFPILLSDLYGAPSVTSARVLSTSVLLFGRCNNEL